MDEKYLETLTKKEEEYLNKIQKEILFCSNDQPHEGSDVHWMWGKEIEIDDLLYNYNVPEKSLERILPHLKCQGCGHDSFQWGDSVGIKTKYDIDLDNLYSESDRKFLKSFQKLEETLIKTPALGYKNPLGKRIAKELEKGTLTTTTISGTFHRARKHEDGKKKFTSNEMFLPEVGICGEGRYNHNGQPHLYLSNNTYTAYSEASQFLKSGYNIYTQQYEINNSIDKILDLSHDLYELSLSTPLILVSLYNFIEKKDRKKGNYMPDYYLSRFIADCAKAAGYNGIKYVSALHYNGYNVVLFNRYEDVIALGEPELYVPRTFDSDLIDY